MVMSNHLHLVVRAPGKNLAAFMGYFLARVAQTLNLLLGRVGPVFRIRCTNRCSDPPPHRSRSTAWPIDPSGRVACPSGGVVG